jgi:Carbohydrate esterase 2 N-terminal/GDSL-like Lipase/Acylhydrolase family
MKFGQIMKLKNCICILIFFISCSSWAQSQPGFISPDNTNLLYTGRIDFSNPSAPLISWSGTSIKANFTGKVLKVILDDQYGKNYFSVIVDGEIYHPFVIEAKKGPQEYTISTNLFDGKHSVEIYKRTEGEEGHTLFKGLVIDGKLLNPPARFKRRIEIFGDSITSGMGNEAADNGADHLLSEKNNYWAYGSVAARELKAELHTTSQSGIGIMISWFPFIMPQFYDQLSAVGNNDTHWDFSKWTPDLVIINLLQNDSWLIDREKRLQPIPTDEQRVQAYIDFVRTIRARYPKAQIICALGSMDATANDKWPNYIKAAVEKMKQDYQDKKIDTLFFDFTGYGQHPRVAQNKANAKKLVNFVRKKMHW